MTTDPDKADSCDPPPLSGGPVAPPSRGSDWGIAFAVLLFLWGAFALLGGAMGLLFLPGTLLGGISIGKHTTLLSVLGWALTHLVLAVHGYAMIVAGMHLYRARWRRGVRAIAVGVLVPVILITAFYIVLIAFGPAGGG